jgi:hypothetical protein
MNKRIVLFVIIISLLNLFKLESQISSGGSPVSFSEHFKSAVEIPAYRLPAVDNDALIKEDNENGLAYQCESRIAMGFDVDISPGINGIWEKLPDGDLSQAISGSVIKATTYQLDFCLVEMNSSPPLSYKLYYSGWDN